MTSRHELTGRQCLHLLPTRALHHCWSFSYAYYLTRLGPLSGILAWTHNTAAFILKIMPCYRVRTFYLVFHLRAQRVICFCRHWTLKFCCISTRLHLHAVSLYTYSTPPLWSTLHWKCRHQVPDWSIPFGRLRCNNKSEYSVHDWTLPSSCSTDGCS